MVSASRDNSKPWRVWSSLILALLVGWSGAAQGQSCATASDMDEATRAALMNTAKRYFDMAARGDSGGLKENSIASVASEFSGIETAVKDHQASFAGAQAMPRLPFLLKQDSTTPLERAEFLCGVFGKSGQTADSAVFVIANLPPGNYAVDTLDVNTPQGAYTVSFVLQQQGTDWKLGGFYAKEAQAGGHDGGWFAERASQFRAKGQLHNAWLYYLQARDLLVPVPFMSTQATDKLYDEMQSLNPTDLPASNPVDLVAGGKTYKLTSIFPLAVAKDFDLVVKYQTASVADTKQTFQDNVAVIKALVAKYPEYRDGFDGVVARGVEPSGNDYGTLLPMKEIK
jgi:hypothetical protein